MMVIQFIVAMFATLSFAILYSAPRHQLLRCALVGATGWIIYIVLKSQGFSSIFYVFISAFVLTIVSRLFAIIFKSPVTMYLIPGIFPIVPGAGIYYSAYYFFMDNMKMFAYYSEDTVKVAFAISFGIIFAMALPIRLLRKTCYSR